MPERKLNIERRNGRRFKLAWDITVRGEDQTGRNFDVSGMLENLGSTGAFFNLTNTVKLGSRVELRIRMPFKKDKWMQYAAEVVRLEYGASFGVAVKFDTPQPVFISS